MTLDRTIASNLTEISIAGIAELSLAIRKTTRHHSHKTIFCSNVERVESTNCYLNIDYTIVVPNELINVDGVQVRSLTNDENSAWRRREWNHPSRSYFSSQKTNPQTQLSDARYLLIAIW